MAPGLDQNRARLPVARTWRCSWCVHGDKITLLRELGCTYHLFIFIREMVQEIDVHATTIRAGTNWS